MNSLNPTAMVKALPIGNFEYINERFDDELILDLPAFGEPDLYYNNKVYSGETGYYFVVDLHVPEHLHDYFSDYPLAPEKKIVENNKQNILFDVTLKARLPVLG